MSTNPKEQPEWSPCTLWRSRNLGCIVFYFADPPFPPLIADVICAYAPQDGGAGGEAEDQGCAADRTAAEEEAERSERDVETPTAAAHARKVNTMFIQGDRAACAKPPVDFSLACSVTL